jgi:putative ATP-dependent endonuclease of OLD family
VGIGSADEAIYLSEIKIKNFRQLGAEEPTFCVRFHEGVTALVGENDTGKTDVIDAIRHVPLTRFDRSTQISISQRLQ